MFFVFFHSSLKQGSAFVYFFIYLGKFAFLSSSPISVCIFFLVRGHP